MTDPVLEALWKKTLDDFDDESAHAAFIDHCQATRQLLEAAIRYRGMAGDHARGRIAARRLTAIATLAVADLETARTPERRGVTLAVGLVLIVLFLGGSVALLLALR
jgi:CHASE2 domain-containing sensor protein